MNQKIICQKCSYYYVTWNNLKPHGCKAYGFKSKLIPSRVVTINSGINCLYYKVKLR